MSAKKLTCGGKGPCCHVGYSHRHCEHCDVVIDTRAGWWPYNPPFYPSPFRPLDPVPVRWDNTRTGTYGSNVGLQLMNAAAQTAAISEHTCEASA